MKIQLIGGAFDGETVSLPGHADFIVLTDITTLNQSAYADLGPPASADQGHDGSMYLVGDYSRLKACLMAQVSSDELKRIVLTERDSMLRQLESVIVLIKDLLGRLKRDGNQPVKGSKA